ncbi:MAG: hypothetical protein V1815_02210 [Candidatus Woesearchaeota archaeon]
MRITDLHDAVDDIPQAVRGIKLENGQLVNLYDHNLTEIVQQHKDIKPIATRIVKGSPFSPSARSLIGQLKAYTHEWRLKRRMQKKGYNFSYMQIGGFVICYDFFKI